MKIQLTQQIVINNRRKEFLPLDELCFLSKNLYNVALYYIRQQYKKDTTYLNYNKLNHILSSSNNVDYHALPYAQPAQQVLRQVDKQYISFYKALKSTKMKGKRVRLPNYKDKEKGRNIFVYTNQCFKLKDNTLYLKTKQGTLLFQTDKQNIQQVRIVPKGNHIVVEIIYNVEYNVTQIY